ncbi:hypothetical protein IJ579_07085 [bacterium]|nr:hypothetical protein [bacterium]
MINIDSKLTLDRNVVFTGALDNVLTSTLRTLDTNPMANAVGLDLISMVGPRTYVDTKERNKYAGAETFFREFTGTLIVCLSASYFARAFSHLANKFIDPQTPINPSSWLSDESIKFLNNQWNRSHDTTKYVTDVLDSISGRDRNITRYFKNIDWENIDWVDEKSWSRIKWDNRNFKNIHANLKDKQSIISAIEELIIDKNISLSDRNNLLKILELRLTNALKSDKINAGSELTSTISNLLRDMTDLGKNVFTNTDINTEKALSKLFKINKIKSIGALALASTLGLFNQYINRKITEKRTGARGFVGDTNYNNQIKEKKSNQDKSPKFILKKILASIGMALMAITVMKVKSPKDFLKKLEFTGPVTSGNAIKTVYASTLIGRFLASDNEDELRETVTRDYLGFLNWLVLGGFAAKGIANILDPKKAYLFNISKNGSGIKQWLNNISLKSHNEIAAQGETFAKKHMWKANLAQLGGLTYSTIALGVLLPKLNIFITKYKQANNSPQKNNRSYFVEPLSIDKFVLK